MEMILVIDSADISAVHFLFTARGNLQAGSGQGKIGILLDWVVR